MKQKFIEARYLFHFFDKRKLIGHAEQIKPMIKKRVVSQKILTMNDLTDENTGLSFDIFNEIFPRKVNVMNLVELKKIHYLFRNYS